MFESQKWYVNPRFSLHSIQLRILLISFDNSVPSEIACSFLTSFTKLSQGHSAMAIVLRQIIIISIDLMLYLFLLPVKFPLYHQNGWYYRNEPLVVCILKIR
jgi:hypothetical protein